MRKASEIATAFAPREALDGKNSFFLVGIGGAGMSALARMLKHRGFEVHGTDSTESPETQRLTDEGIDVKIGHSGEAILPGMALIVTDAIDLDRSPEVARARELNVPILRRSQGLGWLLKDKKVIAVTGTHGKTTTTGMLGSGLIGAGLDPLVIVGANIPQFGGPVVEGKGEWAVVEACEAYDSFHDLDPHVVLLTNLELDHVDFHGSYDNLLGSVVRFVSKVPEDGGLVFCGSDKGAWDVADRVEANTVPYGVPEQAEAFEIDNPLPSFPPLSTPGEHNRLNAQGAATVCRLIGCDEGVAWAGIAGFNGAERRLQVLQSEPITVVDDYAHHPSEIHASLQALRERFAGRRLIVVFQPHLYSRTAPLIEEFAEALSQADEVVLTDIYPAREDPMPGVSSARIAERVTKPVHYVPSRHLLPRKVARMLSLGDVVVGMGAGNIAQFAPDLVKEIQRDRKGAGPQRIVVLYGGDSAEREVSLHSGRAIHAALQRLGHESRLVDATELLLSKGDLGQFIGPDRPDLAFLAVHGTHAEDGAIQGLLELLHIPFTGSGIQASAIAMDKSMTKQVLERHGVRVPKGRLVTDVDAPFDIQPPLIVKPNAQGSTVGLSFVEDPACLCDALANALAYDDSALVEEWIRGMEISVPVLDGEALPPAEIAPASGKYDFASKYTPGATEEIVPARLPAEVLEQAKRIAVQAHNALRCAGATRTDMIVRGLSGGEPTTPSPVSGTSHPETGEGVEIFVLEVNTLPGMTGTSLLPNSARAAGIDFDQLCQRLVEDALRRDAAKT
jgi:UDP-N-acetylmuramate--L-alanine ligase